MRFPITIPENIRQALSKRIGEERNVEAVFQNLASSALELFDAIDVVAVLDAGTVEPASAKSVYYFSSGDVPDEFSSALVSFWSGSDLDARISRGLESRVAPVSYSAFSWPYPEISAFQYSGSDYEASYPREYSVLLPVGSELILRTESEREFSGYLLLMFDSFPEIAENFVNLITFLPELFSSVLACCLRGGGWVGGSVGGEDQEESYLRSFVHDVKHHLLVGKELSRKIGSGDLETTNLAAQRLERVFTRLHLRTDSVFLMLREKSGRLAVRPMEISLNDLIKEVCGELQPLFQSNDVVLNLTLNSDPMDLPLDPAIFPSVLQNLLDNALKYSSAGDKVIVETYFDDKGAIVMDVVDQGIGVPEESRELIFLENYRASNVESIAGSGVGLYLARRIVSEHGGTLELCKEPREKGSCFRLRFTGH